MKFTIEPMSVGEIFSRAIVLLSSRLGIFAAIEVIIVAPTLIFQLAIPDVAIGPAALLLILPMIILGPFGSAAMLHVITQEYLGEPVSLGGALKFALSRFLPLLLTSILAGLGILVGMVACCIPGIYLATVWAFMNQVVVMESLSGSDALGRSKGLVEGYFWNVFAVLLVVSLCVGLMNLAVNIGLGAVLPFQEIVGNPANPFVRVGRLVNYTNYAIHQVVLTVVSGLGQTFAAICVTLLYFDLRNRKEAFDMSHIVKWMEQYRTWRDEPGPSDAPPPTSGPAETGIKPGDAPQPPTEIKDPNAPPPAPPPQ